MKVVLELQDQPSNIKKVTVRHDIVIGRGAECNLRLSAPQVSRRHCFLRIGTEGAFVSDLDSSNGTTLNEKKLTSGKRYPVEDGAVLSVGPVKFVARVQSEVLASEVPEVAVSGGQLDAEPAVAFEDAKADEDFEATLAGKMPDEIESSMNFAVEQAGPSATEDEPTADCVVADPSYRSESPADPVPEATEEESILGDFPSFDQDTIPGGDPDEQVIEVEEIIDDEIIEVVDIIEDDELVDVIEEVDDEVAESIDDEEVLLIDEEDIIEVVGESDLIAVDEDVETGDSVEDDLKNFLQGLD